MKADWGKPLGLPQLERIGRRICLKGDDKIEEWLAGLTRDEHGESHAEFAELWRRWTPGLPGSQMQSEHVS